MKKMLLKFGLAAGVTVATVMSAGTAHALSFTKTGTGGSIPDPGTLNSPINFSPPDSLIVNKVSLSIFGFNHPQSGDIVASLIYNNGGADTVVSLFQNKGGSADFFGDGGAVYTFEDGGSSFPPSPVDGELPGGIYSPAAPLSAFNSFSSVGTWTLRLSDTNATRNGSYSQWALTLEDAATPVPTPAAVLPGLIGMGAAALRKRREDSIAEES